MGQVWIFEPGRSLSQMRDPTRTTATCGDCPIKDACYVTPMAVSSVQKAFKAGRYGEPTLSERAAIRSANVRWGAFGDPAAIPYATLAWYAGPTHTGYTHSAPFSHIEWLMSVESHSAARAAWSHGRRTFRVLHSDSDRVDAAHEVMCPAWRERTNCARCALCSPTRRGKSVCIPAHGPRAKAM